MHKRFEQLGYPRRDGFPGMILYGFGLGNEILFLLFSNNASNTIFPQSAQRIHFTNEKDEAKFDNKVSSGCFGIL
jgi:hypothetical protein